MGHCPTDGSGHKEIGRQSTVILAGGLGTRLSEETHLKPISSEDEANIRILGTS